MKIRFWATLWPSKAVPRVPREPSETLFGHPWGSIFYLLFRSPHGPPKNNDFVWSFIFPPILSVVSWVPVARKRHVGDTLNFRPLGSTSSHLHCASVPSFRDPAASKKHLFAKPMKNHRKINVFCFSRAGMGCSRGPLWGSLGPPGDAQGAPKEAFGGSICVLSGLWGVSGATLVPSLLLFGILLVHFSSFLCSFPLVSRALVSLCRYQRIRRKFLS